MNNELSVNAASKLEFLAQITHDRARGTFLLGDTPAETLCNLIEEIAVYFDEVYYLRAQSVAQLFEITRPYLLKHAGSQSMCDSALNLVSGLTANIVSLCDRSEVFTVCARLSSEAHSTQEATRQTVPASGQYAKEDSAARTLKQYAEEIEATREKLRVAQHKEGVWADIYQNLWGQCVDRLTDDEKARHAEFRAALLMKIGQDACKAAQPNTMGGEQKQRR